MTSEEILKLSKKNFQKLVAFEKKITQIEKKVYLIHKEHKESCKKDIFYKIITSGENLSQESLQNKQAFLNNFRSFTLPLSSLGDIEQKNCENRYLKELLKHLLISIGRKDYSDERDALIHTLFYGLSGDYNLLDIYRAVKSYISSFESKHNVYDESMNSLKMVKNYYSNVNFIQFLRKKEYAKICDFDIKSIREKLITENILKIS